MEKINDYLNQVGTTERHLSVDDKIQNVRFRKFRSEVALTKRRSHLEYKLSAEQIAVAIKKGEKESKAFIDVY